MRWRNESLWAIAILAVCVLVFANSLGGEFVYDDTRQVVQNTLIQDNAQIWKALTSDVWAFKGDGSVVTSNYWRPTFTAWQIINFRLFGLSPLGWHVTNLILHAGVCLLAFASLRRWEYSAPIAFVIALIFAVHPVQVETVAWVSGVPNLLFALAFLGSLWFARSFAESKKNKHLLLATLLYAIALGAKEIGIICLPIYYFVLTGTPKKKKKATQPNVPGPLLLLGAVAAIYFILRWIVLGGFSQLPEGAVGLREAVLSVPSMFAFYLRQAFFPLWMACNYPLAPVAYIGVANFVIPLSISLAALAALFFVVKNDPKTRLAAALFLLPLVPAMNATVFNPDQLVHDRYLGLPLLGILMLIVPLAAKFIAERTVLIAGVALASLLSIRTFLYNRAWATELSLWESAKAYDTSAFTTGQYGAALLQTGRYEEAVKEFDISIAKQSRPRALLDRGRALLGTRRYADAERDLKTVTGLALDKIDFYAFYQAYVALGFVYSEQKDFQSAAKNYLEARSKLPMFSASLTVNLAGALYQNGQKEQALQELESARAQATRERLPESKAVFLRLGMLYAEFGRKTEARAALREYLDLTSTFGDKWTLAGRGTAAKVLEGLK
ncbi:MAG TPA: tetratricopeptide repeat protein [Chthoniobacterales bacterium]|nr:tetratricopeptide repeat protein [Chthoniobacterales bacterium]